MAVSNEKRNVKTIERAIKLFQKEAEKVFIAGFESLLRDAVKICLDMHDRRMHMHTEIGDSYGWIMFHDKKEIKREVNAGTAEATGNANASLSAVNITDDGWVGVVMAGMDPPQYFAINYEFWVMRRAINKLSSRNFSKYFKKI